MLLAWVAIAAVLLGIVAALLTKATVVLTSRLGGERVSRTLAAAECLVEHHAVPPAWRAKLEKRFRGLVPGAEPGIRARHEARARRWCQRELARLISFARVTSIAADEQTREVLVSQLLQVEKEWKRQSWDRMCRQGGCQGAAATNGQQLP